jgi:hypothetical protein
MTFKDIRRIISENQKLDDDKIAMMRLRLRSGVWPAEGGNGGNGHNNNKNNGWGLGWKGRPIISSEEWKKLAGYTELYDNLTSEEKEYLKINLDLPGEVWDRMDRERIWEINPRALQYFPQDIVTVVFNPSYSCPKAPDLYKLWVSDIGNC